MDLNDIKVPAVSQAADSKESRALMIRPVTAAGEIEQLLQAERNARNQRPPFRGRVIYLYDPTDGTTIARPMGRQDAHLGAVEV